MSADDKQGEPREARGSIIARGLRRASAVFQSRRRRAAAVLPHARLFRRYRKPRQQSRWDEAEHHPHTNWGDLFFDLIYVGAAYQLGELLKSSISLEGAAYFVVMFYSLADAWHHKLAYDCRVDADDFVHKLIDILEATIVAAAALHISGGLAEMKDKSTGHALGFSTACAMQRGLHALRWHEVFALGETDGSKTEGWAIVRGRTWEMILYIVAAILSSSVVGDTPMWLVLVCWSTAHLCGVATAARRIVYKRRKGREHTMPMHIGYCLHRFGEWTMLMIGETILGLIVGTPLVSSFRFYFVFTCGFLIAASLQLLHYSTQTMSPAEHAMNRGMAAGALWTNLLWLQSAGFVSLGVSVKLLLKVAVKEALPTKYAWLMCGSLVTVYAVMQTMKACHEGWHQYVAELGLNGVASWRAAGTTAVLSEHSLESRHRRLALTIAKVFVLTLGLALPLLLAGRSPVAMGAGCAGIAAMLAVFEAMGNSAAVLSNEDHRRVSDAMALEHDLEVAVVAARARATSTAIQEFEKLSLERVAALSTASMDGSVRIRSSSMPHRNSLGSILDEDMIHESDYELRNISSPGHMMTTL